MKHRHMFRFAVLFLAAALTACGTGGGPSQDLAQQFLTERNGGTPVAIGVGGPNAPVLGLIESVDGTRLTVKSQIEEQITTVQLADGVKIRKDVDAPLSEITAGTSVTAVGTQQGDVFQADLLRLGGAAETDTGPMVFTSASGDAGAPLAGGKDQVIIGGPNGAPAQPITGIVASISGRTMVIKDQAGADTTVALADSGKIQKSTEVAPAELTVGTFILASGARNGEVYQATQVRIMPAPQRR